MWARVIDFCHCHKILLRMSITLTGFGRDYLAQKQCLLWIYDTKGASGM